MWFVTIHPFDDGNGRIARAIADWALARSENSPQRFYSMSAQIRHQRNDYYDILEKTQKGTLDVTPWMEWFLGCLGRAFDRTEVTLSAVMRKARFWEKYARTRVNDRQRDVIDRLLDGFTGKLTPGEVGEARNALTTRRFATFRASSTKASCKKTLAAVVARAIRWLMRKLLRAAVLLSAPFSSSDSSEEPGRSLGFSFTTLRLMLEAVVKARRPQGHASP